MPRGLIRGRGSRILYFNDRLPLLPRQVAPGHIQDVLFRKEGGNALSFTDAPSALVPASAAGPW